MSATSCSTYQNGFGSLNTLEQITNRIIASSMAERDASQKALEQVQKITESEPVKGEDLVESEDLKRQFREAKERLSKPSGE